MVRGKVVRGAAVAAMDVYVESGDGLSVYGFSHMVLLPLPLLFSFSASHNFFFCVDCLIFNISENLCKTK